MNSKFEHISLKSCKVHEQIIIIISNYIIWILFLFSFDVWHFDNQNPELMRSFGRRKTNLSFFLSYFSDNPAGKGKI